MDRYLLKLARQVEKQNWTEGESRYDVECFEEISPEEHLYCNMNVYEDGSIEFNKITYSNGNLGIEDLSIANDIVESVLDPNRENPSWLK